MIWVRRVALVCGSLVLAIGTAELAFRIANLEVHDFHANLRKYGAVQTLDPATGNLISPPNSEVRIWGVDHTFNSLGMRDIEPPPSSDADLRILLLGDSVVFGQGAPQEVIVPYRLRALLAECAPQQRIAIVAVGVPGWNTEDEERFLRAHLDHLAPNIVVLFYVRNDRDPDNPFRIEQKRREGVLSAAYREVITRSRFLEYALFIWRTRIARPEMSDVAAWLASLRGDAAAFTPEDPGWIRSRAALGKIRDMVTARQSSLVVAADVLGSNKDHPAMIARLRDFEHETETPVIDTSTYLAGHQIRELQIDEFLDPHPNPLGHDLIARGLLETLSAQGRLPTSCSARAR